jgi:hypothetical protein
MRMRTASLLLQLPLFLIACKSTSNETTAPAPTPDTATSAPSAAASVEPNGKFQVEVALRTSDHLSRVRDAYSGEGNTEALRAYFAPGPTGDASQSALLAAAKAAKDDGMIVQRFEVRTIHVDPGGQRATADVFEWLVKDKVGKCRTYAIPWERSGGTLYRTDAIDVKDAPCPKLD